jgi:chromosome segregation ATPase
MTLEVETIMAVALMMAVFAAVAAVGTSLVLGAGFERLRSGFEIVRKQTGFFSDAIHKLEQKVEVVDEQTSNFSHSISQLEAKVTNVGDQANVFSTTVQNLSKKVEIVDKQTGFFSDAIHKLEEKIETVSAHEEVVAEKMERHANTDLISTGKAEALVSHAEDLLNQISALAGRITKQDSGKEERQEMHLTIPRNLAHYVFQGNALNEGEEPRYH